MIIFKTNRKSPEFHDGMSLGNVNGRSDSEGINGDLSLDRLKRFMKFKSDGKYRKFSITKQPQTRRQR
jgi:hypothetical protein